MGSVEERYRRYVMTSFVSGVEPVVPVSARGARITAADGRQYVDAFSGIAVVNAGHAHPTCPLPAGSSPFTETCTPPAKMLCSSTRNEGS